MTDSPRVTWPSPARTTLPLRRMDKTVVERISRFVDMGTILDYSSGEPDAITGERCSPRRHPSASLRAGSDTEKNRGNKQGILFGARGDERGGRSRCARLRFLRMTI